MYSICSCFFLSVRMSIFFDEIHLLGLVLLTTWRFYITAQILLFSALIRLLVMFHNVEQTDVIVIEVRQTKILLIFIIEIDWPVELLESEDRLSEWILIFLLPALASFRTLLVSLPKRKNVAAEEFLHTVVSIDASQGLTALICILSANVDIVGDRVKQVRQLPLLLLSRLHFEEEASLSLHVDIH